MEFIKLVKPKYWCMAMRHLIVFPLSASLLGALVLVTSEAFIRSRDVGLQYILQGFLSIEGGLRLLTGILILTLGFFGVSKLISIAGNFLAERPSTVSIQGHIIYYRIFVSQVKQLNSQQYEMLLAEYPSAKIIKKNKWYDIYITDNFLFVPGLFLVCREEIDEIGVRNKDARQYDELIFLFSTKEKEKKELRLPYLSFFRARKYKDYSGVVEAIMAWAWQRNPDDSKFPEQVKRWYEENVAIIPWRRRKSK